MSELTTLSNTLKALAHPLRLRIVTVLVNEGRDMYLNEIANTLGVNRALAKIHLNKLERADLVQSRVVLVEGEARALRYYHLQDFDIHVSPEHLKQEGKRNGN